MSLLGVASLVKVKRKIPLHPRRRTASSRNDLLLLRAEKAGGREEGRGPRLRQCEGARAKKKSRNDDDDEKWLVLQRAAGMLNPKKHRPHAFTGVGKPAVSVMCLSKKVARLGLGLNAWHSCTFECFLPQPRKWRHEGRRQNRSCWRGRVFVKGVCPLSTRPSVGCLAVFRVQHNVVFGWPRVLRRWISSAGFGRSGASTCLVDAVRPHSFAPFAAPPGSIVLVAVVVLCNNALTSRLHTHVNTQGRTGKDAAPERRRAWRR